MKAGTPKICNNDFFFLLLKEQEKHYFVVHIKLFCFFCLCSAVSDCTVLHEQLGFYFTSGTHHSWGMKNVSLSSENQSTHSEHFFLLNYRKIHKYMEFKLP